MREEKHNERKFIYQQPNCTALIVSRIETASWHHEQNKQTEVFVGNGMFMRFEFIKFSMVNWDNFQFCCCRYRKGRTPSQTKQYTSTPLCHLAIKEILIKHHKRNMFFSPKNSTFFVLKAPALRDLCSVLFFCFHQTSVTSDILNSCIEKMFLTSTLYWDD